jgi:hypothetical protein
VLDSRRQCVDELHVTPKLSQDVCRVTRGGLDRACRPTSVQVYPYNGEQTVNDGLV